MNIVRIVKFLLINANPIDISIEQISLTLPKTNIQLIQMQTLNGNETNVTFQSSYRKNDITKVREVKNQLVTIFFWKLVIPARHRAIFSLMINGASDPSFYHETITFKTSYEVNN